MQFKLISKFKPCGDQPQAIDKLVKNLKANIKHQTLLGVTGSGKTFTMANVIQDAQEPTLVISHNKTLAWQLYREFKEFFPENAVHYFVSYYDYYQPEAYIPQSDTYIEKDAKINEEIDRMRHAATQDLLTRDDVIIVASVSCIYNIGSPKNYQKVSLELKVGQEISRKELMSRLVELRYQRNDYDFLPGTFRTRADMIEIFSITGQKIIKVEFINNKISKINTGRADGKKSAISQPSKQTISNLRIFPANFWVTPQDKIRLALQNIQFELQERLKSLKNQGKLLEAERLEQRVNFDLEMLRENGWCHGVENYSSRLEFRNSGDAPYTLFDYFGKRDFLTFIDESHQTIPQIRGMYFGDRSRKETLIDYGFRLLSALDNRPLKFGEFEKRIKKAVYVSATPNEWEMEKSKNIIVEQLIRPTGLLEPSIEIKPTKNQIKNLIGEIKKRVLKKQRVLVLTLTKRMAEDLAEYLLNAGIKTNYLHAEVKTLERPEILRNLRSGEYDVLVGINLLREGLDLPEVSLIAILDADKEGFLRNETTLIQIMGRAARHIEGHIIMYADGVTKSMKNAITEISRRRKIQEECNKKWGVKPHPINKPIENNPQKNDDSEIKSTAYSQTEIKGLKKEMKKAAKNLDFEKAAEIRDTIRKIK